MAKGVTINELNPVLTATTELPGGEWEVDLLAGPVAGGRVSKKVTTEQLVAYLSGSTSTARVPYDVPTAKRKAVVDANSPAVVESNEAYYGCEFVDEVYGPSQPAYYKCMPSAPATSGGATVWKWFRIDIL